MLLIRIKNFTKLAYQGFDFIKKNGIKLAASRIQSKYKQENKTSYNFLRKKYPERFISGEDIDFSTKSSIEKTMKYLKIQEDSSYILGALKKSYREFTYCQILDDLFTIEEILENNHGKHQYALIQSSQLPQYKKLHRKRRILFITSQVPNPHHGGGNRILNFLKILSEDNDIYLATAYYPHEDDNLLEHIGQYCRSLYRIPYWTFGNNQSEIRNWLNGLYMDIIHYEWPDSLKNYAPDIGRLHIFTYMEAVSLRLLMDLEKASPLTTPWLDTLTQLIHALRIEIADASFLTSRIAVTTKDGSFFRSIYPYQEYVVLNHGVNLDEFTMPNAEPDPQTLVFVGNFGHYPNVDAVTYFFNDIWEEICSHLPNTKIYLVGPNPPKEIARLANNRQIFVTGGVPDVRPYIQKGTICIAPLISGAGLRGKVIEYAALKRTFVATSIATTDLVYENGSDYLRADTASDFAAKIIILLKDDTLRKKMGHNAYKTTKKNYTTRQLVDFLYRLYDHLESKKN